MCLLPAEPSGRALRLGLLAVCALTSSFTPSPAAAQVNGPDVQLELLSQPVWHGPADKLNLRVRVTNDGSRSLSGFQLVIAAGNRVTTRSELHRTFEEPPVSPGAFQVEVERTLEAGESTTVSVEDRVSKLSPIALSSEGGVFPLTVSLTTGLFETEDSFTSSLIYYPALPDPPLDVVLVVPLNEIPSRAADGTFVAPAGGESELEAAVGDGGWLAGWADALAGAPEGARIGLAPTPRTLEELEDMQNGYARAVGDTPERVDASSDQAEAAAAVLDTLRAAAQRKGTQVVLTPYSFPDLAALSSLDRAILEELKAGEEVIERTLVLDVDRSWLFPPAQRIDEEALEELGLAGVEHLFFSEDSLEEPPNPLRAGCPEPSFSLTCPVSIEEEGVVGFALDQEVQQRFAEAADPGDTRLDIQRIFAETAMVREEQPGVADRTLQLTIPAQWHPTPRVSRVLIRGFAGAPWLRLLTPAAGVRNAPSPVSRRVVGHLPPVSSQPDAVYFQTVESARAAVNGFESLEPPDDLFERLYTNILVAHSRTWWGDPALQGRGEAYARSSEEEVERELAKIGVNAVEKLTLTSRRGSIPLTLFNEAEYPVRVRIELSSSGLSIAESNKEIEQEIPAGASKQIKVEVVARASGTFPLAIRMTTPGGLEIQSSESVTVRSTAFNEIALAITFGAFAFLVLFYVVRGMRRRQSRKEPTGASAA
jgi:hypothetical protein